MDSDDMKKLRCPQNWGFDLYRSVEDDLVRSLSKNLEEEEVDEESQNQYCEETPYFIKHCLISYEKYRNEKYDEALEYNHLLNTSDDFMKKYIRVFTHISKASLAFILSKMGSSDKAKKIIDEICGVQFNFAEDACFNYIKSQMLISYIDNGVAEQSLSLARSAVRAVDDEAEFHFSLGNILFRLRHHNYPPKFASDEEFNACKRAVSLKPTIATYSVKLAQLFMESRFKVTWNKRSEYSKTALSIFKKLLENHGSLSGNDIARCIFQLIKVELDPDLEYYAEIALKKTDSVLANHYIGIFYIRIKEYHKAYKCLDKVWDKLPYICGMLLLLKYRTNNDHLSNNELEELIQKWSNFFVHEKCDAKWCKEFYLSISEFYLLVLNDVTTAALHFLNASKYEISQVYFIKITRKLNSTNYLEVLKNALIIDYRINKKPLEALDVLKKLPANIVGPTNIKYPAKSLPNIRDDLF